MKQNKHLSPTTAMTSAVSLFLFWVFACQLMPASAADTARKAYIIELSHQIPATLIPALRPLLAEGDFITTFNTELIVTTSPLRIDAIRELALKLDTPMRNLLITVKNDSDDSTNTHENGISGSIERENIRIDTGRQIENHEGITVSHEGIGYTTHQSRGISSNNTQQQIRAVEGRPAFIYTGKTVSVPSRDRYGNIYTNEIDANRGFYVTARIIGSNVFLEISLTNDSFEAETAQPVVNAERIATTVSGNIGEWIPLGNIRRDDSNSETTLVKKITTDSDGLSSISVKITSLD